MNIQSFAHKATVWFVGISLGSLSMARTDEEKNLAFEKPAIQSASYCDFGCAPASTAVDGNTDGDFFKEVCLAHKQ